MKEETPLTVAGVYDNRGNRVALGFPTGRMLELAYDELNRLAAIREVATGNALADFAYCGPRRVEQRRYFKDPGGTGGLPASVVSNCVYTYNGGQDLIGIECRDAGGALQVGFSHVIDKAGNKLHEVKLHDLPRSHAYAHDGLHRLVSYTEGTPDAQDPNTIPAPTRQQQWTLDKLGNWKTFTETTGGTTTTQDRSHNKVNELRTITVGGVEKNLKYDAAGNVKDDEVFHYRYDEEQRLKAVFTSVIDPLTGNRVAGVAIARYKYDALGRRILKRLLNPDGSSQLVTRFYYDGDRVVEERTGAQNLPSRQYIWGNYVDELLVSDTVDAFGNVVPAARLYALQNSTYSVHALVNDAGTVVERYSYTPYGEPTVLSPAGIPLAVSAVGNNYLFTGRELDAETGLFYFRARTYSARLGRFIQRDRQFRDGMNLYEYTRSRPTTGTDPNGQLLVKLPFTQEFEWIVMKPGGQELGQIIEYLTGDQFLVLFFLKPGDLDTRLPGGPQAWARHAVDRKRRTVIPEGTRFTLPREVVRRILPQAFDEFKVPLPEVGEDQTGEVPPLPTESDAAARGVEAVDFINGEVIFIPNTRTTLYRPTKRMYTTEEALDAWLGTLSLLQMYRSVGGINMAGRALTRNLSQSVAIVSSASRSALGRQLGISIAAGSASMLVPGGGLAAHEGGAHGGHTLARHVGANKTTLHVRLFFEPKVPAASSFTSRATAERAVAEAIRAKQPEIDAWLSTATAAAARRVGVPDFRADRVPIGLGTVGITVRRGEDRVLLSNTVTFRLVFDPRAKPPYKIVTAWPEPG